MLWNSVGREWWSLTLGVVTVHSLGREHTQWCICLLTDTHVRMVARSWSCLGAEPAAMLKTILSTGSKVANSSRVGAAPAIKYHRPRWGSGVCRGNEGSKRMSCWADHKIHPTSPSVSRTRLGACGSGGLQCLQQRVTSASRTPSFSLPFSTCFLAILSDPPTQDFQLLLYRRSLSTYLCVVHSQRG